MKKRFLLVDDVEYNTELEEDIISVYAKELSMEVEIDTVSTVSEVISKISKNEIYDVMIIDMNLPDGIGVDIAKEAREKSSYTRIASLTIYLNKYEDQHQYFDLFLKKPISSVIYRDSLATLLNIR